MTHIQLPIYEHRVEGAAGVVEMFKYHRYGDVPPDLQDDFLEWMTGQTHPLLGLNPEDAFYMWDWNRYMAKRAGGKVLWD